MKFAAFFRNLNLGRANCPNRAQFESAFLQAGADNAQSFLTNGTMVFATASQAKARKILTAASKQLGVTCGLQEPAFLRNVASLATIVATDPFAAVDRSTVYDCYATFLHPKAVVPPTTPRETPRRDVRLLHIANGEVLSVSRKIGNTPGSPNAYLEKLLGLPATTRAWNTVVRLVEKHG